MVPVMTIQRGRYEANFHILMRISAGTFWNAGNVVRGAKGLVLGSDLLEKEDKSHDDGKSGLVKGAE